MLKQDTLAQQKKMWSVFFAIVYGNFEEVKRILKTDPKCVNIKDGTERTPLDVAISRGYLDMAKFLFEKGGRPNLESYCDRVFTPVHATAKWGYTSTLKWVITEGILPLHVLNIKHEQKITPLDYAIRWGRLEIAQFLFEKDGRPNLDAYRDREWTPVHEAALYGEIAILKWVFAEKEILPLRVLNTKTHNGWTPLDIAITYGRLDAAQLLWEKGGRPTLDIYRDREQTPVHRAAEYGKTAALGWVFTEKVLPLNVLNIKDEQKMTPLDIAISKNEWETAALLRRLMHLDPVFLAMQRAKRDHHQMCVLRRLPDELLDMVVDEVASRFHLVVEW